MLPLHLCLILWVTLGSAAAVDVFQPGPYTLTNLQIQPTLIPGLNQRLDVWSPTQDGTYPILYYLDGFAMGYPSHAYSDILRHIASHGVVVAAPWTLMALETPEGKLPDFENTMVWVEQNLEDNLAAEGLNINIDFNTTLGGCHSAGCHVLVSHLKTNGCGNYRALVLMSPVDGADPWGIIDQYCITPGEYLNFAMPVLELTVGYDPIAGSSGPACAPAELSNDRFWYALEPSAPRWYINATKASHLELLDEDYFTGNATNGFCPYDPESNPESRTVYRTHVAGTSMAFFYSTFGDDECSQYLTLLQDPNIMLVETVATYINPTGACPTPTCSWAALPTTLSPVFIA